MRAVVCMLTHAANFKKALSRVEKYLSAFDVVQVLVPHTDRAEAIDIFGSQARIYTHKVIHDLKGVKYGAMRYEQFNTVKRELRGDDVGLMIDDDINYVQWIDFTKLAALHRGDKSGRYYSRNATSQEFRDWALSWNKCPLPYFTTRTSSKMNLNRLHSEGNGQPHPVARYSWLLGFFLHSPNPYDPHFGHQEDRDASNRIIQTCGMRLGIMRDPRIAVNCRMNKASYGQDRLENLHKICALLVNGEPLSRLMKGRRDVDPAGHVKIQLNIRPVKYLYERTMESLQNGSCA